MRLRLRNAVLRQTWTEDRDRIHELRDLTERCKDLDDKTHHCSEVAKLQIPDECDVSSSSTHDETQRRRTKGLVECS